MKKPTGRRKKTNLYRNPQSEENKIKRTCVETVDLEPKRRRKGTEIEKATGSQIQGQIFTGAPKTNKTNETEHALKLWTWSPKWQKTKTTKRNRNGSQSKEKSSEESKAKTNNIGSQI